MRRNSSKQNFSSGSGNVGEGAKESLRKVKTSMPLPIENKEGKVLGVNWTKTYHRDVLPLLKIIKEAKMGKKERARSQDEIGLRELVLPGKENIKKF